MYRVRTEDGTYTAVDVTHAGEMTTLYTWRGREIRVPTRRVIEVRQLSDFSGCWAGTVALVVLVYFAWVFVL